jgi:hypothetical protein
MPSYVLCLSITGVRDLDPINRLFCFLFAFFLLQAQNGVLLTDGAGKIRRSFADEELGLNVDSDVIQFRYNGAKGILLKVDDNDADLIRAGPEENIFLRPSNVKFVTGSLEFGCVNQSKNQGNEDKIFAI